MISNRKDDHIKYALEEEIVTNDFDLIKLNHDSLPSLRFDDIDLSTNFLGKKVKYPFYINAMTGGSIKALEINKKLALIAKEFGLPFVLGSQSAALKDDSLIETYQIVRDVYPDVFLVSNVSANATLEQAKKAISMVKANALSIHLNVIQELVMNEGDRDFSKWESNIKTIINNVKVPVIVKEVGFGMSKRTIRHLSQIGVKIIDVSGKGGTNFARIERKRYNSKGTIFDDLGISTVDSLKNAKDFIGLVYASGGIRNALDIFKSLTLGAKAVGLSNYFLQLTNLDLKDAIKEVNSLISDLKKLFIIYGVKSIKEIN
ncbi:MAG TPA: type 2 isopentenyl-diphosphate Delta-isomerase [Haploplasma sp.]|nr:type 2 isopentenyl-diphosphate Delta-isomerase [Haploplasma sp.]